MEFVKYVCEDHIATITIDNQKALNALSTTVLKQLQQVIDQVKINKDIYCVVLTGAGEKAFVAGADIAEMKDKSEQDAKVYSAFGNQVFANIESLRCPVIAAINGFALGGGCELAMSCDIRLASENAIFAQPEVGLGITPGFGGTQRLARLIPTGIAKEMIYTGVSMNAKRAYEIGLVNGVYPQSELMKEAYKLAHTIVKQAPIAVAYAKQAINEGLQCNIEEALQLEVDVFGQCFLTEDQTYGMNCFLEKVKEKEFSNQ